MPESDDWAKAKWKARRALQVAIACGVVGALVLLIGMRVRWLLELGEGLGALAVAFGVITVVFLIDGRLRSRGR